MGIMGVFLIMGNAGFTSSTVGFGKVSRAWRFRVFGFGGFRGLKWPKA